MSKKLKYFMTADLRKIVIFWAFHIFAYFWSKWANIYISRVLWSTGINIHHLKGFPESRKKMNIFMTADLRIIVFLGHFTCLHISHPNEKILTFQVSCGQLVVAFIILEGFLESKKIEVFHVIFGQFTFSHISHKSGQIFTFQVSCGPGGGFHHFKRVFRKSKKMFFMTAALRRNAIFVYFTYFSY